MISSVWSSAALNSNPLKAKKSKKRERERQGSDKASHKFHSQKLWQLWERNKEEKLRQVQGEWRKLKLHPFSFSAFPALCWSAVPLIESLPEKKPNNNAT